MQGWNNGRCLGKDRGIWISEKTLKLFNEIQSLLKVRATWPELVGAQELWSDICGNWWGPN